jgi:hypothetical protein
MAPSLLSAAAGCGGSFDRRADHQRHVSRDWHVVFVDGLLWLRP